MHEQHSWVSLSTSVTVRFWYKGALTMNTSSGTLHLAATVGEWNYSHGEEYMQRTIILMRDERNSNEWCTLNPLIPNVSINPNAYYIKEWCSSHTEFCSMANIWEKKKTSAAHIHSAVQEQAEVIQVGINDNLGFLHTCGKPFIGKEKADASSPTKRKTIKFIINHIALDRRIISNRERNQNWRWVIK